MQDRELYETILGLQAPWQVERVELKAAEQAVDVWVHEAAGTTFPCPTCGGAASIYDHVERRWRHLDTCQFQTRLCAQIPRVRCATHGVLTVAVPWAEPQGRFTRLFERLAIAWLKEASLSAVAKRLGLSWDEVRGIQARAVGRGLARRGSAAAARIGIDEKSFLKRHQYVSVVTDLDHPRILHVADDRKAESLTGYFESLTDAEKAGTLAIAMDMWEPYRKVVRAHVPEADKKIVFDKFHILQHLHNAVDQVRRQEHRSLKAAGDKTLTGTKYAWLKHPGRFDAEAWEEFSQLHSMALKTARAWVLKETLPKLWEYRSVAAARTHFQRWYYRATHSRLPPMVKVARMMKSHLENILTYLTHRITNAVTEGLNAKIQWIKYQARGYRNREAFKMAIMFHCGGLDLEPRAQ